MDWFFIILVVFGIIMGTVPGYVADNIKKCVEKGDTFEGRKAIDKINAWLYILGLTVYLTAVLSSVPVYDSFNKEIKKLETRIETLEQQVVQSDTTSISSIN